MLEKHLDLSVIERLPSGAIDTLKVMLPEMHNAQSREKFLGIITEFVRNYRGTGIISHHDFGNYLCNLSRTTHNGIGKKLNELGSTVYCHGL